MAEMRPIQLERSDVRPHQAPVTVAQGAVERAYYVRLGSDNVVAQGQILTDLLGSDLGRVRSSLGEPESDIRSAFQQASDLLPGEARFREALHNRPEENPEKP
jgi:hypothetical protein